MKNRKVILLIIVLLLISLLFIAYKTVPNTYISRISNLFKPQSEENTVFSLSSKDNNNVLLSFENNNGINKIVYPNGFKLNVNGKNKIAIDYQVEKNKEYIFQVTDTNNNTTNEKFVVPSVRIEITKKNLNTDLENMTQLLKEDLNKKLIATNFINIGTGEQSYVDSTSANMQEVFQNWTAFGDGTWSYNSSTKTILNTKNSSYYTGYYYPNGDFEDLELSFNAMTTDGDDDMIGAMIRFNKNSATSYTSYLFLLDRHDNGGVNNGEFNGINRIINVNFPAVSGWTAGATTKLSVNPNLRWTRNKWQNYKIIAKGNLIQAYIDNTLVAQANDNSIARGTYGFLAMSQANTYFKDIIIKTSKSLTLTELLQRETWNLTDINIVINLNNAVETSLEDQNCIDIFNWNDIYYLGVGTSTNKTSTDEFLTKINNKGEWIDGSNYEAYVDEIANYISNINFNFN